MKNRLLLPLTLLLSSLCSCSDAGSIKTARPYELPESSLPAAADDGMVLVTSEGMLEQVFGEEATALKPVDFKRCNLLLARGVSNYGIADLDHMLIEKDGLYTLCIDIRQNLLTVMQPWSVGYLVPKNVSAADIRLALDYISSPDLIH